MSRRKKKHGKTKSRMQGTPMAQSSSWAFTFFAKNDYTLDDCTDRFYEMASLSKTSIAAVAMACELCPKTNRQHIQGFLQTFTKSMSPRRRRASLGAGIVLPGTYASG